MRFWFNALFLVVGLLFLARGLTGRSGKNPILYFGLSLVFGGIADFLPTSAATLRDGMELLSAITMIVAAVFMFAFAEPAKAKSETTDS